MFYLLGDHLRSTNLVVDDAGNKVAELRYKAWGETRFASGTAGTDYRFTGQREEATFGLYYHLGSTSIVVDDDGNEIPELRHREVTHSERWLLG